MVQCPWTPMSQERRLFGFPLLVLQPPCPCCWMSCPLPGEGLIVVAEAGEPGVDQGVEDDDLFLLIPSHRNTFFPYPRLWLVPSSPLSCLGLTFSCLCCPCFSPWPGLAGAGSLLAAIVPARTQGSGPGRAVVHLLSMTVWISAVLCCLTVHPVCARSPSAAGCWPCLLLFRGM